MNIKCQNITFLADNFGSQINKISYFLESHLVNLLIEYQLCTKNFLFKVLRLNSLILFVAKTLRITNFIANLGHMTSFSKSITYWEVLYDIFVNNSLTLEIIVIITSFNSVKIHKRKLRFFS